jgi:hypothetical protein
MSGTTEKLLELLREGQWTTPSWSTTVTVEGVTDEMTIIPESENGPMLRIAAKTKEGTVIHTREMNLSAVDGMIGKLIKMRDLMAQMKDNHAATNNQSGG